MNRWRNRIGVVTGASSGIGSACCKKLLDQGMVVVGLARRENKLRELRAALPEEQAMRFHFRQCDVSVEQQVIDAFSWIDTQLGGIDVLINSAGIHRADTQIIGAGNSAALRAIVDTNVMGVAWCTREAFRSMRLRHVNDGHVVIVNSVTGHKVPHVPSVNMNLYAPSKFALTAMTEVLRQEFLSAGTKTKVTSISPGFVDTEIIDKNLANSHNAPLLHAKDVADAIGYCIQTPPHVQIHELTIKPVGEYI